MDNWLMLVVGLAACVLIEVVAYRAYKRYRARKEALFTKESLGEVFQDMESTRAYLLRSKAFLKQCARRAGEEGDEAVACIVDGLLAGERAQLESLEALRQKLDVRSVDFQKKEDAFASLAEALESYAIGEVEGMHADMARSVARGQVDRERELSLCPSCGALYFGRRPAFCGVCNQPNFEMERIRHGVLD